MDKVMTEKEEMIERIDSLENRVELLEIIAKKGSPGGLSEEIQRDVKKVIQINAKGRKYFCETDLEQHLFTENNPGVVTESYNIELPTDIADRYLSNPENKKQFVKKEK